MTLYGIDISGNQTSTPPLTGKSFCIVKATEGLWHDPMYATHCANVRKAGIALGAYAFNRSDVDVASQATEFAKTSGNADFWAIDVEGAHMFTPAQATLFMQTFRKVTGHKIGMYLSASPFPKYKACGQDWNWIASYPTIAPELPYHIWQYQGSPLDLDQFAGDIAAFRALFGTASGGDMPTIAPGPMPVHYTVDVAAGGTAYFDLESTQVAVNPLGALTAVVTYGTAVRKDGKTLRDIRIQIVTGGPIVQVWIGEDKCSNVVLVGATTDPAAIETARRNGYNAGVTAVQQAASGIKLV
jgi:hypothetical protein